MLQFLMDATAVRRLGLNREIKCQAANRLCRANG
jgi:hypothetical protein